MKLKPKPRSIRSGKSSLRLKSQILSNAQSSEKKIPAILCKKDKRPTKALDLKSFELRRRAKEKKAL